ncbi:MAG: DUF3841 domain-containing protein [Synergistaceae bacterium]
MVETVKLYTRQNDKTLHALETKKRIINVREYVKLHFKEDATLFLESYDWFTQEAQKIVAKPDDVTAPIWCSISSENCRRPIPGTVVYILEVPKEKVIYFDETKWDRVLNRIYIPTDEKDNEEYEKRLQKKGIANKFEFFIGKYKNIYPEENEIIKKSWNRIFKIDNWSIYNVCGNIWEIKSEWVRKIIKYGEPFEE